MNRETDSQIAWLFNGIGSRKIKVEFGTWPDAYDGATGTALSLKRQHCYDESMLYYMSVVKNLGYLPTELGRSMAKVLTAMQEYYAALIMFYICAGARWTAPVKAPAYLYTSSPDLAKSLETEMPTSSAANFYDLRDALKEAARGKLSEAKKLSASMSGSEASWKNSKSDNDIIKSARAVLDLLKLQY